MRPANASRTSGISRRKVSLEAELEDRFDRRRSIGSAKRRMIGAIFEFPA
jgi:hypothetical protein